jgi:hypothetical protein
MESHGSTIPDAASYQTPTRDDRVLASGSGSRHASRSEEVGVHLSEWRGRAPHRDSLTAKVLAVVEPVIVALGTEADPSCWIVWGDDPSVRYLILVPTASGLVEASVRVNVPQEGPRVSAKLVRWNRVQLGELAIETAGGHRLLTFQVEGQVLHGTDADADAIAGFALGLYAAMDGRAMPVPTGPLRSRGRAATKNRSTTATKPRGGAKAARGGATPSRGS